jgi:hypothetical protein
MHVQPWILISPLLICAWTWNVQALMGLQCSLNSVRAYLLNIWNQLWLGNKQHNTMQISFLFTALACTLFVKFYPNYFFVTMQADEAVAVMANTKQILNQFIWNSGIHSEQGLKHIWVNFLLTTLF